MDEAVLDEAALTETAPTFMVVVSAITLRNLNEWLKMMLERFLGPDKQQPIGWEDLGHGAPTIIALAQVAAAAFVARASVTAEETESKISANQTLLLGELSDEAKAILYTAKNRGIIAIRATNHAFDSIGRLLSVHVEIESDHYRRFGSPDSPQQTIRFIDGFAELARQGLLIHHLYHEFSLSPLGFDVAASVDHSDVEELLKYAVDPNQKEW